MIKKLSTVAAALLSSVAVQAATVEFSFGLPVSLATTEINQTGALGFFNPALGTLTGAMFTVNGEAAFSFGATNTAAQQQSARLNASTDIVWTTDLAPLAPFLTDTLSLAATSGMQVFGAGATRSFGPLADSLTANDDLGAILASLQGAGTFNVGCSSLSAFGVQGGGGNLQTTQSTMAGCGAKIVYTYTPTPTQVPEPGSLALAGLALAAAGLTTLRRKA